MASQDLEFLICQSLAGDLSVEESARLAADLAADAEGQQLLAEHLSLDSALKLHAPPLPGVNWAGLAAHISQSVGRQDDELETERASRFRIGRWAPWMAIAAAVALAIGVAPRLLRHQPANGGPIEIARHDVAPPPASAPFVVVAVDTSPAPVVNVQPVSVAVGPAGDFAREPGFSRYANGVVARPSRVTIASSPVTPRGPTNSPF